MDILGVCSISDVSSTLLVCKLENPLSIVVFISCGFKESKSKIGVVTSVENTSMCKFVVCCF